MKKKLTPQEDPLFQYAAETLIRAPLPKVLSLETNLPLQRPTPSVTPSPAPATSNSSYTHPSHALPSLVEQDDPLYLLAEQFDAEQCDSDHDIPEYLHDEDLELLREGTTEQDEWDEQEEYLREEPRTNAAEDFGTPLVSMECEQLLLGSFIHNPNFLHNHDPQTIRKILYYPCHKRIYDALSQTKPPTLEKLIEHFSGQGKLEAVGGIEYLSNLQKVAREYSFRHDIESYERVLEVLATLREEWKRK